MKNIFAFTETNYQPSFYPGLVSINKHDDGQCSISVRQRGDTNGQSARIAVPAETLEHLASDIMAFFGAQEVDRPAPTSAGGMPASVQGVSNLQFGADMVSKYSRICQSFKRECDDTDNLLRHLGLDPEECRTDGGSLNLGRIESKLASQPAVPVQQEPKLVLALPIYEKRSIVIASEEIIDGERIVCVAIKDAAPVQPAPSVPDEQTEPINASVLEKMAKERPDECFLKGSGVLKLIGAIRQLEREARQSAPSVSAGGPPQGMPDLSYDMLSPDEMRRHVRTREQERCQHDYKSSSKLGGAICGKCGKIEPPPIFSQAHSDAMYRAGMIQAGKMPQPSAPSVSADRPATANADGQEGGGA